MKFLAINSLLLMLPMVISCSKVRFGGSPSKSEDRSASDASSIQTLPTQTPSGAGPGAPTAGTSGSGLPGASPTPTLAVVGTCSEVPRTVESIATLLTWTRKDDVTLGDSIAMDPACTGPTYVAFNDKHRLHVAALQCGGAGKYKLLLASSLEGTYYEISDGGGHGQDHCELIKPGFRLPNDDEITSGGCTKCEVGAFGSVLGRPTFNRDCGGEAFTFLPNATSAGDLSPAFYRCDVDIP